MLDDPASSPAHKSLPLDILLIIFRYYLDGQSDLGKKQHARRCCLAVLSREIRALVLQMDQDLLSFRSNSALMQEKWRQSVDNPSEIRRLRAVCELSVRRAPPAQHGLLANHTWTTTALNTGVAYRCGVEVLRRLDWFDSIEELELVLPWADSEEPELLIDQSRTPLWETIAEVPAFAKLTKLSIESDHDMYVYHLHRLLHSLPSLVDLKIAANYFESADAAANMPLERLPSMRFLRDVDLTRFGCGLDVLFARATPVGSVRLVMRGPGDMLGIHQRDALGNYIALRAPKIVVVNHLNLCSRLGGTFVNVTDFEARSISPKSLLALEEGRDISGSMFEGVSTDLPALHAVRLGAAVKESAADYCSPGHQADLRELLIKWVANLPRRLSLELQVDVVEDAPNYSLAWSTAKMHMQEMEQACASAGVELTWW